MKHTIQKSIFCTLLFLLGVSHAAWGGTRDLYLVPNSNWLQSNARFAVYCFDNGTTWVDMVAVDGETNLYKATIDDAYPKVIFVRLNPATTENNWNDGTKWNQTADLTLADAGTNNCYTITDGTWDKGGGTWSTYEVVIQQYVVAGNGSDYSDWVNGKSWSNGADENQMDYTDGVWSKTYTNVGVHSNLQFKIFKKGSWDNAIGHSESYNDCSNVTLSSSDGNIKFATTALSTVTITYDGTNVCVQVIPVSSCTTPTIAWSTAPADGTVGGSMTAAVSTNQSAPTVTWTSSNTSVATVDANGNITYLTAGTTTITASYIGDGTTYCAETVSVSKDITVTAAATALNIYVQGRFKVRTSKGGSEWKYTGSADDNSWNTSSTNIKFEYEEATGYYKLNTYCSVRELAATISNTNYYFHFKEGSTEYGATESNVKPALEADKRTIQSGSNNFIFTTADCTEGDNVVLYLDWSNKKFWYAVDAPTTYTVTISAGTGGSVEPSGAQQVGSTAVAITATADTGYAFDSWTVTSGNVTITDASAASTTITATSDGEVTANFKTASYLVDYHANGHGTAPDDVYVNHGDKAPVPTPPTAEGYTFGGWYTESSCTNAYNFDTPVTADLDLYAKWTKDYSTASYYYYDEQSSWADSNCKELTKTAEYAYVSLPKSVLSNNKFKIFDGNNKSSWGSAENDHLVANAANISESLKGNIALADAGDGYKNINYSTTSISTSTFYVILYYPNTSLNSSSTYVIAASTILPGGETPKDTYWYFDEKHTGWTGTIDDKWKLVDAGDYAYVAVTAYSGTSNKFKIFPDNPKDDNNVYANGDNIATDELAGNIMLTAEGGDYNNIKIESTCDDYYVVLYYPGTTLNAGATPLVAAMYDLPGTTAYNVSFGVVGDMGGTITAKYGCSTITSGQLVTRATFTATPETGYVVEGWYSDEAGTTRIDAAGTSTTYTQTISAANNTVYVKFGKVYAIYFKPNEPAKWDNTWAYIFGTTDVWDKDNNPSKGVSVKGNTASPNYTEYGQMNKLNDSVFYYNLQSSSDQNIYFALNNKDQHTYGELHQCDAIYRGDFHKDMPVFIAEKGQSESVTNKVNYYNEGVWMKFNDTDPGYNLGLRNQTDNNAYLDESYRFTAAKAGDYISTVTLNLVAGTKYSFLVKNDKSYYFKITEPTTCTSDNHRFELYVHDSGGNEVVIQPTITGAYTFQLNLANGKVEIDVLYPTTEYRLVYVEKSGSTFVKFHPSHTIAVHEAGCDTVSLHVRPNVKSAEGTESENPNTCEVWLQQFITNDAGTGMEWVTRQEINVKTTATITGNGVYNFVIEQAGGAATVSAEKIHPYTGNYFIRSDASKAGWDFVSAQGNLQNRFWYSDYARQHETFDHYCCHWTTNGTNLNFVVANDYSYCLTDTLVQNAYEADHNYVDATGQLLNSANIRFMWNSYDNSTDRAYLAGAGDNLFLLSQKGIYDMSGNQQTSLKFSDQQNWVYRLDIKSDPNAFIKIKAPYAGYTQYFKGSEEAYSFQLIKGLSGKTYNIRVIYDFKTNHLICAWLPEGEITDSVSIETDMMIIRQNQGDARQLTFNPADRAVGEVKNVYCVLTLTKDYLSADTISDEEKKFYWISFPFDVRLSEVFGCGVYSNDYVIQYYDGAERAAKGCWADSPTYWRYYWNPSEVILKKGMGYVLYIDWEQILAQQFTHGNTEVSIYFPSANTEPMDISGQLETVTIPAYKCTIERCDRYIYDSNWNIIGVPAYANIDKFGNPMIAQQIEDAAHGLTVGFMYVYQPEKYSYYVAACSDTTFRSMQAYMVQFGGTISWQEKSVTGEVVPSQRMMRAATPDEEADRHTLRLVLQNAAAQQVDHTYIRTQETNVTNAFDLNYDLTKQFSSGANVYSLAGENRITLAANVLPMADAQKGVSIGVTLAAGGVYTLALPDGTDGLNVVLYDRGLGTYTDLSLAGYTFEAEAGTLDDRFELIVKSSSVTTQMTDATASYVVYVDNGVVKVEGVDAGTMVRLFDTVGRLVWTRLADGNLEIPAMAAGTYLLQIGNAVEKIVIR
ncbi:MAG: InlB B-repeat-containing protein [Paludibacteraceae bacterium]